MKKNILKISTQEKEKKELNKGKESKEEGKKTRGLREIKKEIKERLINGETVEEVKVALSEELSQEKIESICEKYEDLVLLSKGMPIIELVCIRVQKEENESEEDYKERVRSYQMKYASAIYSNSLGEKINFKKEEIKRRLEEGQSPEQILQDKELNVCVEAIDKILCKLKNKKILGLKEIKKEIKERLINGETVEEVKVALSERISQEKIESICNEYEDIALLSKGIPAIELAHIRVQKEENESEEDYKKRLTKFKIRYSTAIYDNNLSEKINLKKEEIKRRLEEGQSPEQILQDKELNVCIEAIEKIIIHNQKNEKILADNSKNEKILGIRKIRKKIKTKLINGETVEEIKVALSEELSQEEIESICNEYQDLVLLSKGMPTIKLARIRVQKEESESEEDYKEKVRNHKKKYVSAIYYNNLEEKINLKKEEIKRRLEEGQSPEQILQDKELNVCIEAIEHEEREIKRENKKLIDEKLKKQKEIKKRLINGETINDICKDSNVFLEKEEIEKIYEQNEELILLVKAISIDKLADMKIQRQLNETEEEYKNRRDKFVKKCSQIISKNHLIAKRKYKRREIEKKLLDGQNRESILANRELNVCMEAIKEIEKEIGRDNVTVGNYTKTNTRRKHKKTREETISTKIEYLKENYRKVYYDSDKSTKEINATDDSKKLDRNIEILLKKLENASNTDKKSRNTARTLAYFINQKIDAIESIEELEKFSKLLTSKIRNEFTSINNILRKLDNKIFNLKTVESSNKRKTELSEEIQQIITGLVKGDLDITSAQEIIEKEAIRRVKVSPKNNFSLTEEQQRRQIIIQIRENIKNNAEKYPIENPQNTISKLDELSGKIETISVDAVIRNFIKRKKFNEAKEICNHYIDEYQKKGNEVDEKAMIRLSRIVKNEELGDLILRGIKQSEASSKQSVSQYEFWQMIEKGIESNKIKLATIPLGKSESGRNITLADVWPDEKIKGLYR